VVKFEDLFINVGAARLMDSSSFISFDDILEYSVNLPVWECIIAISNQTSNSVQVLGYIYH
jgi:hypothetical protein